MTRLVDALRTKDTFTENGMSTNSTSLKYCVDLFFQIGALRGQDKQKKINAFIKAYIENPLTATKILFWSRDIRGGAGERGTFRDIIEYLANNKTETLRKNLNLIPEYGRWDDLLTLVGTKLQTEAIDLIVKALKEGNGLAAKWLPRGNTKDRVKKRQASALRKHMKLEPKAYRKMLVELSNTVEQLMCAKDFGSIKYEHVPSKAMSDYMRAFGRNDQVRFKLFLESISKGETKINTGAVYPYDITKNLKYGSADGASEQWKALPNFMEGNNERVLPVVDVSGSMASPAGNNPNVTCMDVSISLGLYISERNEGPFKDAFITFSSRPKLEYLSGNLADRYNQLKRSDWGYNTNFKAVFNLVLNKAKELNVPQEEMPTMIIVLSDMEFDEANRGLNWNPTAQELIEKMYNDSGYEIPKIVYWNIQARNSNMPVKFDKQGTALVSGFNPNILKSLLSGKDLTPFNMMMEIIGNERYLPIKL
jgi:hypothetical protein